MRILRTLAELDAERDRHGRSSGLGGVCVPTMGALHEGHATLIRLAASRGRCVVWVFVNPTQFNDSRDFERYPRSLDADAEVCRRAGCEVLFAPRPQDVYPSGVPIEVPALPSVATEPGLEDRHRPGHFAGVCQVVLRLFRLLVPDAAVFGEKDWQQVQVVRAMAAEHMPGVDILGVPTVRDADGVALSSRNALLSLRGRFAAVGLSRALEVAGREPAPEAAERSMADVLRSSGLGVEYAVVRDAETLGPPRGRTCRALVAAWSDGVRLIDNAPWPGGL